MRKLRWKQGKTLLIDNIQGSCWNNKKTKGKDDEVYYENCCELSLKPS